MEKNNHNFFIDYYPNKNSKELKAETFVGSRAQLKLHLVALRKNGATHISVCDNDKQIVAPFVR